MNATRLPAHHRRILAEHLNVPEAELDKALARRREAEHYIAERMEYEGQPFRPAFAPDRS